MHLEFPLCPTSQKDKKKRGPLWLQETAVVAGVEPV